MLAVCGDSFIYGTNENTWPKILADKLNMPLLNLSLIGSSNYGICFQLDYLTSKYTPKIIIIGLTAYDRFELDDDEYGNLPTIKNFNYCIDEAKSHPEHLPFDSDATIMSGSINSQKRNYNNKKIINQLLTHSYRIQAQYQSWCIQYMISKINCPYRLYRNIYPRYHKDIKKYKNEEFYGLENLSGWRNIGPYDFEKEIPHIRSTNHLSPKENKEFAEWVYNNDL